MSYTPPKYETQQSLGVLCCATWELTELQANGCYFQATAQIGMLLPFPLTS